MITAEQIAEAQDWLLQQKQVKVPGPIQTCWEALLIAGGYLAPEPRPQHTITGEELQEIADSDAGLLAQARTALREKEADRSGSKIASTAYVQRCLGIGYNAALRIMETLEKSGFITAPDADGKRWVVRQGDQP